MTNRTLLITLFWCFEFLQKESVKNITIWAVKKLFKIKVTSIFLLFSYFWNEGFMIYTRTEEKFSAGKYEIC